MLDGNPFDVPDNPPVKKNLRGSVKTSSMCVVVIDDNNNDDCSRSKSLMTTISTNNDVSLTSRQPVDIMTVIHCPCETYAGRLMSGITHSYIVSYATTACILYATQ